MIRVSCAIIQEEGKILVTQRGTTKDQQLKWEFPGGKVEANESPEECLLREIREELGILIRIIEPFSPQDHDYGTHSIRLLPFLCSYESGALSLSEHQDARWLTISELPGLDWAAADIAVVEELIHLR